MFTNDYLVQRMSHEVQDTLVREARQERRARCLAALRRVRVAR